MENALLNIKHYLLLSLDRIESHADHAGRSGVEKLLLQMPDPKRGAGINVVALGPLTNEP